LARDGLPRGGRMLASAEEVEQFFGHLQTALRHVEFLDDANAEHMMFSLRQLFGRARLEPRDVKILRGILSAVAGTPKRKDG